MKRLLLLLMSLFNRQKRHVVVRMVEVQPSEMTVYQWRSNEGYCNEAAHVLASPVVIRMLQVVSNSNPAFNVLTDADIYARAIAQARAEGYTMAIEDFKSLARHQKMIEPLESDFKEERFSEQDMIEHGYKPASKP